MMMLSECWLTTKVRRQIFACVSCFAYIVYALYLAEHVGKPIIGDNCDIHPSAVIHLCHDAYVGDNTTVGNALFEGVTEVGPYSKLDNHVHFAHNCKCGENCFITACSLLMGSTTLDNNVWLAPNAVTLNGVHVHDDGFVGAISFANKEVFEGEVVAGIPARVLRKIT